MDTLVSEYSLINSKGEKTMETLINVPMTEAQIRQLRVALKVAVAAAQREAPPGLAVPPHAFSWWEMERALARVLKENGAEK